MCPQISDAGMTGLSMLNTVKSYENQSTETTSETTAQKVEENQPIAIVRNEIPRENFRISLRSKAEEEIVNDARRKQALLEFCEQTKLSECEKSDYSVANLKGLKVLKLGNCNKITDVTLKYNFKFPELREINLTKCQQVIQSRIKMRAVNFTVFSFQLQISIIGIQDLVNNCPSLEILNLSECHNINDKCIQLITEKLLRLTSLSLQRCHQLTDFTLDYIAINCKNLKV